MWANTLPGRCASLNMSKNNPPACPIAKPRGLAALLQWDKYFTTQYRETPGLWGMPGWHTPRLSLPFLHSLLCAEDLAHTFLPRPNLLDTEVKGLHKTRQMQFGKGRTWKGSVRDIAGFCCSKDGAEMGQTSQSTAEDRGMSSNLPLPQQGLCAHIPAERAALPWKVIFCLPPTLWLCWIQADEGLWMLSQRGRATTATKTFPTALDHLCCSTAHRGDSPLCSLQTAWVQPDLQVMGFWMETDNAFLDLSGCQKTPHGNQAKLPVRTVEDKCLSDSYR